MVKTKLIEKGKVLKQKKLNTNDAETTAKISIPEGKSIPTPQKKLIKYKGNYFCSFIYSTIWTKSRCDKSE